MFSKYCANLIESVDYLIFYSISMKAFLIEEEVDRNAKKGNGSAVSKKKSHAGGGITRVVEATANNRFTRTSVTAPEDDHAQL